MSIKIVYFINVLSSSLKVLCLTVTLSKLFEYETFSASNFCSRLVLRNFLDSHFTCWISYYIFSTAVGKAFAVLSDADKRQRYDMYGADGVDTGVRRRRRSSSSGSEYEDEPYDAQEIFNMFFGGGFPGG